MNPLEAAALSEIHCFDPSWKEGTLPLSQDCVKQFFLAGAAYERERANILYERLQEVTQAFENSMHMRAHKGMVHVERANSAMEKWRQDDSK